MILFKFVILSFFVLGIKGDCPDGFFHAGNSCYLISPDEMTEAAAQEVNIVEFSLHSEACILQENLTYKITYFYIQFCWGRGGYLIEIMTQEEENAINPFLSNSHQYWLGLSDYAEEGMQTECRVYLLSEVLCSIMFSFCCSGQYVWQESHEVAKYFNWNDGEPNDSNWLTGTEDCVVKHGGWEDFECNRNDVLALCETYSP